MQSAPVTSPPSVRPLLITEIRCCSTACSGWSPPQVPRPWPCLRRSRRAVGHRARGAGAMTWPVTLRLRGCLAVQPSCLSAVTSTTPECGDGPLTSAPSMSSCCPTVSPGWSTGSPTRRAEEHGHPHHGGRWSRRCRRDRYGHCTDDHRASARPPQPARRRRPTRGRHRPRLGGEAEAGLLGVTWTGLVAGSPRTPCTAGFRASTSSASVLGPHRWR